MVLARFVLLAAVLLAASSVSAAVTIDLGPSDWRRWGDGTYHHHTRGLNAKFGQTIRMPPMNTNLTVTRNPVVPYGSIANGAKNFLRVNPASIAASAAVTGLFLAVDWVFDQATGEWMKEGEDVPIPPDPNAYHWQDRNNTSAPIFSEPYPACESVHNAWWSSSGSNNYAGSTFTGFTVNSQSLVTCRADIETNTGQILKDFNVGQAQRRGSNCPSGATYNPEKMACTVPSGLVPLTQPDWDNLEAQLPALPASQVGDAAGDIQRRVGDPLPGYSDLQMEGPASVTGNETTSTTVDPVTGDNIVTTSTTTTNISYGDTTITTTNTTTTNTYTNGTHTSTTTVTETPGELPVSEPSGSSSEWPGFCDWASVVCNFIDWFQEPFDAPDVEWPLIEDQDYEEEFDFTLAASCPEPYTIELALFPPVQFNWQPFCDLATFIRPLVLASAAIFAAFISLGIARARN